MTAFGEARFDGFVHRRTIARDDVTRDATMKMNPWAIVVATVAAFVFSSLYYSPLLLGKVWLAVDPAAAASARPSTAKAVIEIARTFIVTLVLAHVMTLVGVSDWKNAVRLAIWLWLGFSAMMWVGAIMWEKTPWAVAAIHSGDWLVKTVLIAAVLGLWRR